MGLPRCSRCGGKDSVVGGDIYREMYEGCKAQNKELAGRVGELEAELEEVKRKYAKMKKKRKVEDRWKVRAEEACGVLKKYHRALGEARSVAKLLQEKLDEREEEVLQQQPPPHPTPAFTLTHHDRLLHILEEDLTRPASVTHSSPPHPHLRRPPKAPIIPPETAKRDTADRTGHTSLNEDIVQLEQDLADLQRSLLS